MADPNVHTIRLRYPWDFERHDGGLRLSRKFNRPTGLGEHLQAWLVVEGCTVPGRVSLNGVELGRVEPADQSTSSTAFLVTQQLKLHNQIVVDLCASAPPLNKAELEIDKNWVENLLGQVRLEIRGQDAAWVPEPTSPAYERDDDVEE